MPNFSATYTNRSGQTRTLQLQASDPARARRELRRRGIVPSSLEPVTGKPAAASTVFGMDLSSLLEAKPGIREKALFANKLAALVDAGVPIVRSLDLMARQQRMPLFKRALTAVSTDVNQGGSLGAALRSQIQTGGQQGMQTLERALANLVQAGAVDRSEALAKASKPDELMRLLEG